MANVSGVNVDKPATDYRGGPMAGFGLTGRALAIGEEVVTDAHGPGRVVDAGEGGLIFYLVAVVDGSERRVKTNELRPVNNP